MAFPAYSNENEIAESETKLETDDWLQCSSFIPVAEEFRKASSKKQKKSRKVKKYSKTLEDDSRLYRIESEPLPVPQVRYSKPVQMSSSSAPEAEAERKSKTHKSGEGKTKKKKRKTDAAKTRYFSQELELESDYNKMVPEEYFKMTRELNILLREHTHDVESWCKYIALQDKGEGTKNGIASKKLSIVDKALEHNPTSDILLTTKLALMEQTMPYDKVVSEAKILASKHVSSKIGWRWLISSTQFNLTRLTAPGLINHFGSMLEDANKRGGQPKFILDVFLEVGMFLRHAGLWELMWTLVEQYLEICFTVIGSEAFKITVALPQEEIDKIEDGIMTSGLPLHALWMRTEHLRSCVHFLPTTEDLGDHQRLILPEDVAPLLYPISTDLSARLSGVALTLLKVPPLPCSEAFVSFLGLKNIPWHLESSEILLTAMLPSGVVQVDAAYLDELKELLVPPQYISEKLGSACFFEAVSKMLHLIAEHSSQDKINFLVWLIRWYRFCIKTKSLSGPSAKPLLSDAKNILKKQRTALPIYTEYALLEEQAGNVASSLKVLETAINLQEPGLLASKRDQRCIFAAYRAYAEVLLRQQLPDHKDRLFKLFIAMAFGEKLEKVIEAKPDLILKALERFDHVSAEFFDNCDPEDPGSMDDVIIGPANLHWLACHAWFSYVQRGKLSHFLQSDENLLAKAPTLAEGLIQLKIDVLGLMKKTACSSFPNKEFTDLVVDACVRYPNNTSFLHTLSSLKFDGVRWGKISSSLVQTGSQIAVMFFALLSKNRLFSEDVQQSGAITKMYSTLRKCAESQQLERCPMLWRLILQYVSTTHNEDVVEKEYHKAVEKCPWVKILYYEAAVQLPKLLADIQDLLTEKELRIHVTPEELEILREPAPPEGDAKESAVEDDVADVTGVEDKEKCEPVESEEKAVRFAENERSSSSPSNDDTSDDDGSSGSSDESDDERGPQNAGRAYRYVNEDKTACKELDYGGSEYSGHAKYGDITKTSQSGESCSSNDGSTEDGDSSPQRVALGVQTADRRDRLDRELWERGDIDSRHKVYREYDHASRGSVQDDSHLQHDNLGKTRWESEENLTDVRRNVENPPTLPDDASVTGTDSGQPEADSEEVRRWDEEKLRIAKRLWEDRQRAKRKMEELSEDYYDPADPNDSDSDDAAEPKRARPTNDMSRLEEIERAKMAPDTCEDDTTKAEYEKTEWTKERLESMRAAWEARKNK